MFWGLQMEPSLRYSQQVPQGFRITKATLHADSPAGDGLVQVFVEQDGADYAIATLKHGSIYDCPLDLRFAEGEDICFYLKGDGVVFLTGHELHTEADSAWDMVSADGMSSSEESSDLDDEEEDESDGPEIRDVTNLSAQQQKKLLALTQGGQGDDDEDDDDDDDFDQDEDGHDEEDMDEEDEDSDESDDDSEDSDEEVTLSKPGQKRAVETVSNGKTPEAKKAKMTPQKNGIHKEESKTPSKGKTPQKVQDAKTPLKDDDVKELKIEDLRPGSGPVAKKGRTVHVYYTGMLLNGKKFDSCTSGKPFTFQLGTGSVIQGWDKGLEGMKVGGKRRLIIPAKMAYGKRATGPIPANAALRFEVELKAVN